MAAPRKALILPGQDALASGDAAGPGATRRLGMYTGLFNLLRATVTELMIVRPGSTTGV
ncbi:hypothetical protein ACYCCF_29155 [Streptomyces argenteolus]|uniref:hypothetical protein n=1 Tax=Streptomyces sp. NPDC025273 TaxID=3155251 RepID=UPI0033725FB0